MTMAAIYMGGSLLSSIASNSAANKQAEAAKEQARAMRKQAAMIQQRALINKSRMRLQGSVFRDDQVASFAASGVAITSGSVLATLNDSFNKQEQNIEDMMTDAEYQIASIKAGANVAYKQGQSIEQASGMQAFGSLLSAGANAGMMLR